MYLRRLIFKNFDSDDLSKFIKNNKSTDLQRDYLHVQSKNDNVIAVTYSQNELLFWKSKSHHKYSYIRTDHEDILVSLFVYHNQLILGTRTKIQVHNASNNRYYSFSHDSSDEKFFQYNSQEILIVNNNTL
jgi:hypothetical protein